MSFCFKRKEAVPQGVRRLAAERIEAALDSLKDYRSAESVHGVRKDIKRVRAVLRLARERIPKKAYRRQTELLRKAADRLAPTRDAYVKGAALRDLRAHFQGQLGRGAFRELRKQMEGDLAQAEKRFARKKSARKVKQLLKRMPKELESLEFDAKGWNAIAPGLKTAFARGREAYFLARKEPSPEHLHDWRKRVKDLWYQVSVLRPIYPEQVDAMAAELKTLSEYLGDDHDLFMLHQSLEAEAGAQRELFGPGVLSGLIEQRRRELELAALQAGAQIYAEKPSAFCDRLARYWGAWRDGKKPGSIHQTPAQTAAG
jgi:CHAD domain-containing protein